MFWEPFKSSYLRWMNTDVNRGAVRFFALDSLDINDIFCSIALNNFADLLALIMTPHHLSITQPLEGNHQNKWLHTWTSSSFLIGILLTPYFCLNSLLSGADIILLRIWEAALKCFFLFFLLEEDTNLFILAIITTYLVIGSQLISESKTSFNFICFH